MIVQIFSFALIGILAGVLSGLLGLGGGIVTIPCLLLVFSFLDIPASASMHLAIGTSLGAMVFNTLSASYAHYKRGAVIFPIIKPMIFGILVGGFIGATIAKTLPSNSLKTIFGIFEILVGIRFLLPQKKVKREFGLPRFWVLSSIALGVSTLSTMLGIGGGMINVPILTHFHVPVRQAVGTASALSFIITLMGAIYFLLIGTHSTPVPEAIGYLYIPAFITIGIFSFFAAPYGAKLAHHLPSHALKRVFGVALLLAGGAIIFS